MRLELVVATTIAAASVASVASAETIVVHENVEYTRAQYHYREGVELGGYAGVGYGVGLGARLGATFRSGVYLGGAFTYYSGNAAFIGGELGYKFWAGHRWELRPYVFVGPAFVRVGDDGFGRLPNEPDVVLAFQPGLLVAYHFGPAYISGEGRAYVSPNPGALAFLGGLGVNL